MSEPIHVDRRILLLMGHVGPLPSEDSRVTDVARFAVLHDAAESLLTSLDRGYLVERRESKEQASDDGPLVRTVWLVPHTPAAATLAVGFSDFPKIILRGGRWYQHTLPSCGCDACGDDPEILVTELRTHATALVEGGLWERVRRGVGGSWSETLLVGPDFRASQQAPLTAAEARAARREGLAAAVQWAPWPSRRTS